MSSLIAGFAATIITLPVIGWLIFYIIMKLITNDNKKSFFFAVNISTFLLIFSVHFIAKEIWGQSFLGIILAVLIGIAMVFVFLHWKFRQEIQFRRVMRGFWRFSFLLFFSAYIILVIAGLVNSVLSFLLV